MGRIFSAAYRPTAQMPFKQTFRSRQPAQMVFNWSLFPRPLGLLATGCFLLALANTAQERVFQCLKLGTPNLSCNTTREGYSLEGEVKTSFTLRITDVSPKHSGRFICSVMSSERNIPETEPCSLVVRDVLDVSATTTTEPAKPAVTTDLGGQGRGQNDRETTASQTVHLIAIYVILPLIIIAFIFAAILLWKRGNRGIKVPCTDFVITLKRATADNEDESQTKMLNSTNPTEESLTNLKKRTSPVSSVYNPEE